MVQPAGHARDLFEFPVETDGIALKRGHVGVAVEGVKSARGMPCAAGGQLRAFQQHHIGPTQPGKVIENAAADDAAADHGNTGGGIHGNLPDAWPG